MIWCRLILQPSSISDAAPTKWWCSTGPSLFIKWCFCSHVSCSFCCGNETFLCGDSELKTCKGFWFTVTYGLILPWWVPKLRNVGRIPQQSCRIIVLCLIFKCWLVYGACNRWCFFFQEFQKTSLYRLWSGVHIKTYISRVPSLDFQTQCLKLWHES